MRFLLPFLITGLLAGGTSLLAGTSDVWHWAFPNTPVPTGSATIPLQIRGSRQTYTDADIHNPRHAIDWFPDRHPPMPKIVQTGHETVFACGYCHQPDGNGRPENSALTGLSPIYIAEQVRHFADGSRQAAVPGNKPAMTMATIAKGVNEEEIATAASYFGGLRFASHVRVVEVLEVPAMKQEAFVYRPQDGAMENLGVRIIEVPDNFEQFEMRDPNVRYTAYVPRGSVAAGRKLAVSGGPAGQPCTVCHGAGLKGGIAPPLAGRSPTMLFRQLAGFKTGARANPQAAPMRAITAELDGKQMIALAAYAATQKP
ncbi:hypothetical protein BH10PLA2_BH10PLA2_01150 [soil metagenome]